MLSSIAFTFWFRSEFWFFELLGIVLVFTVPLVYEKYDDKIDSFAEKATIEIKKQYKVFDEKVLSQILAKIPKGALSKKKD